MSRRQPTLNIGPLPAERINKALGTELLAGDVLVTSACQIHAARRHPDDYPVILPHIAEVVREPLYVGDDFRNAGKIELIGRVAGWPRFALVAVSVRLNEAGAYEVASFYFVSAAKIEARKAAGYLRIMP